MEKNVSYPLRKPDRKRIYRWKSLKTIKGYRLVLEDEGTEGETIAKLATSTGTIEIKRDA